MSSGDRGTSRRGRESAGRYLRRAALQLALTVVFLAVMLIIVLPWVTNALSTGLKHAVESSLPSLR